MLYHEMNILFKIKIHAADNNSDPNSCRGQAVIEPATAIGGRAIKRP